MQNLLMTKMALLVPQLKMALVKDFKENTCIFLVNKYILKLFLHLISILALEK